MSFKLNDGEYVFCLIKDQKKINSINFICSFKELNGFSIIMSKIDAINNGLYFYLTLAWITLETTTSLDSIGITSLFSQALANEKISCNVVASLNNDHIFVPFDERYKAIEILNKLNI